LVGQIQVQGSTGGIIGFHAEPDNNKAVQFVFGFRGRFFLAMLSLHFSSRDREAGNGVFDSPQLDFGFLSYYCLYNGIVIAFTHHHNYIH
jgi:hypothetical protein